MVILCHDFTVQGVEDLSNFAIQQFEPTNKTFVLTSQKTSDAGENLDIGLGWLIPYSKSGAVWHGHMGGTGGYSSIMLLNIKRKNGIIILSNVSAYHEYSHNLMEMAQGFMEMMEKDYETKHQQTLP